MAQQHRLRLSIDLQQPATPPPLLHGRWLRDESATVTLFILGLSFSLSHSLCRWINPPGGPSQLPVHKGLGSPVLPPAQHSRQALQHTVRQVQPLTILDRCLCQADAGAGLSLGRPCPFGRQLPKHRHAQEETSIFHVRCSATSHLRPSLGCSPFRPCTRRRHTASSSCWGNASNATPRGGC